LKLIFENPSQLSSSTELDTLSITFIEELSFKSNLNLVYVPYKTYVEGPIPP